MSDAGPSGHPNPGDPLGKIDGGARVRVRQMFLTVAEFLIRGEPRPARFAVGIIVFVTTALGVLIVVEARKIAGLVPLALVALVIVAYALEVGKARDLLRDAVATAALPSDMPPASRMVIGRAISLVALARAFVAANGKRGDEADRYLEGVECDDLGPWETRVYDASVGLSALARGDAERAGEVAPKAIPVGNRAVDEQLVMAMLRAGWKSAKRLTVLKEVLAKAKSFPLYEHVVNARIGVLNRGPLDVPPARALDVADVARNLGDPELASAIIAETERRGVYR